MQKQLDSLLHNLDVCGIRSSDHLGKQKRKATEADKCKHLKTSLHFFPSPSRLCFLSKVQKSAFLLTFSSSSSIRTP